MSKNETTTNKDNKRKVSSKQIVAILCIVLLVAMYIITLFVALFDSSGSGMWFTICLFSTMFLPLLAWIYIWLYGRLTNKHTIADFDIGKTGENETKK